MALSKLARTAAISIIEQVNPSISHFAIMGAIGGDLRDQSYVYLIDEKRDGGVEAIYTYIQKGTGQEQLFIALKGSISNSHFVEEVDKELLRIGFY